MLDCATGQRDFVSESSTGAANDDLAERPSISADGRFVAFQSLSTNLAENPTAANYDSAYEVYLHDRDADGDGVFGEPGAIRSRLASSLWWVDQPTSCTEPSLSADASTVVFTCYGMAGSAQAERVFAYERAGGAITRVDVSSSGQPGAGLAYAGRSSVSADGRHVAFWSSSTNLTGEGLPGIFVRDRQSGRTRLFAADVPRRTRWPSPNAMAAPASCVAPGRSPSTSIASAIVNTTCSCITSEASPAGTPSCMPTKSSPNWLVPRVRPTAITQRAPTRGRRTKKTAGTAGSAKRRAAKRSGGNVSRPTSMTTKLTPREPRS